MFNLKFRENLKNLLVKEAAETAIETIIPLDLEVNIEDKDPTYVESTNVLGEIEGLDTLKTMAVDQAIQSVKEAKKKKATFFLASKSVLVVLVATVLAGLTQVSHALADDDKISRAEYIDIAIVLVTAVSTILARASEGDEGVYTPDYLPGLSKSDYDGDGVPDDEDSDPYDASKS